MTMRSRQLAALELFGYPFDGLFCTSRNFPRGLHGFARLLFSLPHYAASFGFSLSGRGRGAFLLFADGGGGAFGCGDDLSGGGADGFAGVDHSVVKSVG